MSKNIILLGMPGVGKGTNAELIIKDFDIPHISTGEIFRAEMENKTELGEEALSYINKGNLVPDSITNDIVDKRLSQKDVIDKKGFLLDGYPRNIQQAESLDTFLKSKNTKVDFVIYLSASDETIYDRLINRGRKDDTKEIIENRIKVAKEQTLPLVNYYENQNKLITIDGNREINDVYKDVKKLIENFD